MSYQLLSKTTPRAMKEYRCIWCPEKIEKSAVHVHEVSKYDGELQDNRWHPECWIAAQQWFIEYRAEEFSPHEFERGACDQAGIRRPKMTSPSNHDSPQTKTQDPRP